MRILLVKLSSLGDVVHAMPALQDIRRALPLATIDWVVEPGFAPLVQRCEGVHTVIECNERQWRKAPLSAQTRQAWRKFKAQLQATCYDAVLDLQGLTKSALISRLARLTPTGQRFAMANQTDGSSFEAPTRWVADQAIAVKPHSHAVDRSRELCAKALGYDHAKQALGTAHYGLRCGDATTGMDNNRAANNNDAANLPAVALVHGTSRADKLWPLDHWVGLAGRLIDAGYRIVLPHGNDEELARSHSIAQALREQGKGTTAHRTAATPVTTTATVEILPRLHLADLTDALGRTVGVIGVDSGLSHIAVALDLPHVQIYNFDTAWRTGPPGDKPNQCSVFASPSPSLAQVWSAWQAVSTQGRA